MILFARSLKFALASEVTKAPIKHVGGKLPI